MVATVHKLFPISFKISTAVQFGSQKNYTIHLKHTSTTFQNFTNKFPITFKTCPTNDPQNMFNTFQRFLKTLSTGSNNFPKHCSHIFQKFRKQIKRSVQHFSNTLKTMLNTVQHQIHTLFKSFQKLVTNRSKQFSKLPNNLLTTSVEHVSHNFPNLLNKYYPNTVHATFPIVS